MTHKEILEQTKSELDRLVSEAKRKLDNLVKPELEVGKWYKSRTSDYLVRVVKLLDVRHNFAIVSGFDSQGNWRDNWDTIVSNLCDQATDQEVEDALVKEAKRRGFVNGAIVNNSNVHNTSLENFELFFKNEFVFNEKENTLRIVLDDEKTWAVFKDGKWAEVIKENRSTLDQDIKALKEKYPNLKFTITIEDNL